MFVSVTVPDQGGNANNTVMFAVTNNSWLRGLLWNRQLVVSGIAAPVLALADGGIMGLEHVAALEVLEGSVWVTARGEDHVVEAGDRWKWTGSGKVVVLAVGAARVRVVG